jgi:hypothetical protein
MADVRAVLRHDLHGGRNTRGASFGVNVCCLPRGARIGAGSKGWTNRQAVASFRTSCEVLDASAFLSDPTAPHLAAFYLAIARSAVSPSPFLRGPSPNCDRTKTGQAPLGAGFVQVRSSRYAGSLVTARRVTCRPIDQSQDVRALAAVLVICRSSAGSRQADGSRSNVVMSGVVDSAREGGHRDMRVPIAQSREAITILLLLTLLPIEHSR